MFTSKKKIIEKTGKKDLPRDEFLQSLMNLYEDSQSQVILISNLNKCSLDHKKECVAHLANFAYDPVNFDIFIKVNHTLLKFN
jgi:hypothetical protein